VWGFRARRVMRSNTAGVVEDGAGAVPGGGHEVAVDLVGDLDALVPEPPGDLGDRDAAGQGGGGIAVAQGVRDELWRQPGFGGGALEVLLMRRRSVTAGAYAEDETIPSRTAARSPSTVSGTTAVFTVWVDNEYVWQIQAVTLETREWVVVIVLATTTVTAQLWDFGVPIDPMDWPALPRALTGYCL
jgi:hypothetical protein